MRIRIYHNFIWGHESLGGKTPEDIDSIKVEGQNKWITLIQNATKDISDWNPHLSYS